MKQDRNKESKEKMIKNSKDKNFKKSSRQDKKILKKKKAAAAGDLAAAALSRSEAKLELKERIIDLLDNGGKKYFTGEYVIDMTARKEDSATMMWELLSEMEDEGLIARTSKGKYGLPKNMGLVAGKFQLSAKGFGFVLQERDSNDEKVADVFIPASETDTAMNDDMVMAEITGDRGKNPEGKIIKILQRANERIVGVFRIHGEFAFVTPDDKRLGKDIYVNKEDFHGACDNQKVVVKITSWPEAGRHAEGAVVEILGNVGEPGVDILSIMRQYDLPMDFPQNVKRAAGRVPKVIKEKDWHGRLDRRDWSIVTIDGEDAKDLDDAVHLHRMPNGNFYLGVYIADVSYYVKKNTLLDKEAEARATSVYLVDRVLPMLPTRLSNGICSLNPDEDRLVMACEMEISPADGHVENYEVFPAVIHSKRRLSYRNVREMLEDKDPAVVEEFSDVYPMLKEMGGLCDILQKKRKRRGAINFDMPEQKVMLDGNGKPLEIIPRVHGLAESIIEEFMLAANETVAEHLTLNGFPCVYRVHEKPSVEKMESLQKLLMRFGIRLEIPSVKVPKDKKKKGSKKEDKEEKNTSTISPLEVQRALSQLEGLPEERLVNTVALRSMRQAVYQMTNEGHFGLAAQYYCHFTSPIRRYPDLMIHRLLHEWLKEKHITKKDKERDEAILAPVAKHCSEKERAADLAERDTVDLKKAEYMLNHIGEEYEGVISGVTAFGIFVELPIGVEGLVHITSMVDDYYEYVEEEYALYGDTSGKVYRLGSPVKIKVKDANVDERTIDFALVDAAVPNRKAKQAAINKKREAEAGKRSSVKGSGKKTRGRSEKPSSLAKRKKDVKKSAKAGKSRAKKNKKSRRR